MATLATALLQRKQEPDDEQLLKLFWNRAELKKELAKLRREKDKLGDQLRQQETTNLRTQQRLDALENLLGDPLQAANAMVYYQLRGVWQHGRKRLARLARDLSERQRSREEQHANAQFEQARQDALAAIDEKLVPFQQRARQIEADLRTAEDQLAQLAGFWNFFRRKPLRDQAEAIRASLEGVQAQIERQLVPRREKETQTAPPFDCLSIEGKRNINLAIIAMAQELLLNFTEQDVANLARDAAVRSLADLSYGTASECRELSGIIETVMAAMGPPDQLAGKTRRRAEFLHLTAEYRRGTDTVPAASSFAAIAISISDSGEPKATVDRALSVNVLADEYWDIYSVLLT